MNSILHCFLLSLLLFSCTPLYQGSANQSNSEQEITKETSDLNIKFQCSHFARMFIKDFKEDFEQQNLSIEDYTPSKKLQESFLITNTNNEFFVQGSIRTNKNYKEKALTDLNIHINSSYGNRKTVIIPLQSFFLFLEIEGIDYFEMNPKNKIK